MNDDPPVAERVQVVPLGFEYERLRRPIFEWKADKVVAVAYDDSRAAVPYLDRLVAELAANERIELERRECDIFDLYDTLGTVAAAIDDHEGDDVYVNLSGGSKITAIAGMIACMATGATPIYARPDYGPAAERVPSEPLHDAVERVFSLPTYPIESPSATHVAFLRFIDEREREVGAEGDATETDATADADAADARGRYRGASKKELVEFARAERFRFVAESSAETEKGLYRLLDRHVVDPLESKGYVDVAKVGRRKYLSLTEAGRNTLRAYRHLA
ncbi:HFX_2341 family transcriptional regulator domain-containing protein [Halorussus sp. AFM4]|uniref:HFX_2341 family transcriptional regulator domain-containing protein n=1 Tax=Halorussus sp. AFM4 TaxID=3421651 RepID=UPI003EBB77CB